MAIFTIVYNIGEGVAAIYLGVESESVSLLGFGIDSLVEVASGFVVLVVLRATRKHERVPVKTLRRATAIVGVLLCVLGASAMAGAVIRLVNRQPPLTTIPGIVVSAASLSFMFVLWLSKRRAAVELDSSALAKDADCSLGCIQLSVALFTGSLVYYLTAEVYDVGPHYWWVDAVITVELARRIGYDGFQTLRAVARPDFDGTAACCG
jgi:divalent metal cation (Fe/Co/Zn/Cd) transporter